MIIVKTMKIIQKKLDGFCPGCEFAEGESFMSGAVGKTVATIENHRQQEEDDEDGYDEDDHHNMMVRPLLKNLMFAK